jgi:crotonobetainyl-CoA:carnitine CoA-transferase CaiB-like acyl-CoA transferase
LGVAKTSIKKNYISNQQRVINRKKLFSILNKEVKKQTLAYLQKETTKLGIPFAKIRNLKEVFELPKAKKLIKNISYNKKKYSVVTSFPAKTN